jgi:hypothetical protein
MSEIVSISEASGASDTLGIEIKTNFAIYHLWAAARAARSAYEVQQANLNAVFGPWFEEMIQLVPVSVVMAGAALEAAANEVIQNILDNHTAWSVTDSRKELLEDPKNEQTGNATARYRQVALLLDTAPAKGSAPWQDADLLVKFRNAFMHLKPSWDRDDVHNGKLVKGLRNKKIPIVPAYKDKFLFPYGFLTYGCAKWSVRTVLTFSAEVTKLLNVHDTFVCGLDFTLP